MVPIILSTCGTNCSVASSSTFPHAETTKECACKLQVRHRGTTYLPDALHPTLGEQNYVPESKLKIHWDTCSVESLANHSLRHATAHCNQPLFGTTSHRKMAQEKRLHVRSVGASNVTSRRLQVRRLQKRKTRRDKITAEQIAIACNTASKTPDNQASLQKNSRPYIKEARQPSRVPTPVTRPRRSPTNKPNCKATQTRRKPSTKATFKHSRDTHETTRQKLATATRKIKTTKKLRLAGDINGISHEQPTTQQRPHQQSP